MIETLLVWAILGAGMFGGGIALARATHTPYVGMGAAWVVALWMLIAGSYAMPFGWAVLVGDVAALLVVLVVGGVGWLRRAEPAPPLAYAPLDVALLGALALLFVVPALVLPVPLDTDAQGFGYLALMAREGGSLTNLAPFNPELDYLYAPGLSMISAYLSERLDVPMHRVQFAVGAVFAVGLLAVLYDWGHQIGGRGRGRAHVLAAMLGTGLFTAYMDSHYTSVMGLMLGAAFLAHVGRLLTDTTDAPRVDVGGAALMLAALVFIHPDTTIIIGLGFGAWLLWLPFARPRPSLRRWLIVTFGVPLLALIGVFSWLTSVAHLLGGEITSPFSRYPDYWRVVLGIPPQILYHGAAAWLALVGVALLVRRRDPLLGLSVGWLLLILDFSTFGIIEHTLPLLAAPIVRYDYPFSLAWHGPIIPYALMGGVALGALGDWAARRGWPLRRASWGVLVAFVVTLTAGGVLHEQVLAISKGRVTFFGAFASAADVEAMGWLRENTPPDAYVLNFPGPQEGDWVPVIAERRSVYYRPQPFFTREGDPLADTPEQVAMRAFWLDPADPSHAAMLRDAGVTHVIVPQVVGNPSSFATHVRWRRPFTDIITDEAASHVSDAAYLTPVFDADGATVYAVR